MQAVVVIEYLFMCEEAWWILTLIYDVKSAWASVQSFLLSSAISIDLRRFVVLCFVADAGHSVLLRTHAGITPRKVLPPFQLIAVKE